MRSKYDPTLTEARQKRIYVYKRQGMNHHAIFQWCTLMYQQGETPFTEDMSEVTFDTIKAQTLPKYLSLIHICRRQLAVYQRASNDHIMTCLGMRSPNQLLELYLGVM